MVLATNVAETSLTVPGIHYVVDPGTARISRYSARLKVQRLPIEPISQASADQRKGRCGRTTDGIAIRLYSEENFAERPRFTDPEILRTSLAAVILQMAAIDLGDVEDFPFLDPPDRRQVRDGIALLQELDALDETGRKLTPLGRKLAALPIDPRMGRMVLEADRLGCTEEVIVIAAALSIQDVRERPADQQAQADQAHARHADESSDFLAYLNLWRYLHERRGELSVNQFRKQAKGEFLHYLRIREWQDLVGQIRQAAKQVGIKITHTARRARGDPPGDPDRAALAPRAARRRPARLSRARAARASRSGRAAAIKGQPSWVMVSELVETSRLWGRTAAKIDPRWVEPLAEHLVRRTYEEPRWEKKRASVVATERVTLYGLPIVAGRAVAYGALDPVLSPRPVHPPRAGRGRLGHAPPLPGRQRSSWSRRSRRSRSARAGATSSSTTRRSTTSTRARIPDSDRLGRPLRPLVARRAQGPPRPAHVHARAADQPGGGRGRPRAPGHVAPGRAASSG